MTLCMFGGGGKVECICTCKCNLDQRIRGDLRYNWQLKPSLQGRGAQASRNHYTANSWQEHIERRHFHHGRFLHRPSSDLLNHQYWVIDEVREDEKEGVDHIIVNCPTRWSLLLLIGYWCWSSSWRWQPHIRGCRLHYPLPRAEMRFLVQFFSKMYLLYVSIWWKN